MDQVSLTPGILIQTMHTFNNTYIYNMYYICCIKGLVPQYTRELCCSTMQIQRSCYLCSDAQAKLIVRRSWTATRQHRAFSVTATWNGLPTFKYLLVTQPLSLLLLSRPLCLTPE